MNFRKRPKLIGALFTIGFIFLLSACGGNQTSGDGDGEGDGVVLKVPSADIWGQESAALQVMYDLYQKDNPDVELQQITVQDINTALAAGEAPDLLLQGPYAAAEAYKQGYVEPLDAYYEEYNYDEKMFPWAKNAYAFEDKILGIPWNYEGLMLVYNKTMFEENGWELPANYNELMELSKEMDEKGTIPFAWGTSDTPAADNWWVSVITNSVLGSEGAKQLFSGDIQWTDPRLVDAFQRFADYWNAGYMSDKKSHAITQEDASALFITEKAAMKLDGTWSLASDLETDFEVGYAPFPSWLTDGEPVIPVGVGSGFTINAGSEHKDEAAELLSYFFHPDVVEAMAQNGIPEPIEADYSGLDFEPHVETALNMISEAASNGESGYIAYSYASPSVAGDLQTDVAGIYLGNKTVEDWLADLQELKEKDAKDGLLYKLENY